MTSTSSRLLFALLTLLLTGCQIPLGQVHSGTRPYSLKLSLSSPSLKTGERGLGERVLLPTAVRVDVAVKNDGAVVAQKTVAMTEGSTAVVLQLEVLKTYDFTAKAFDAADKLVFAGAMQVVLTGDVAGVLNLFPILTDAGGNEVPWPTVAPSVALQPAGGSVTQAVSLKSGESTSFLLDFASEATEFTFTPPGGLEVYLQKVAGGGVIPLPGTLKVAKADSPEGVWVTYFARSTPGSLASLGRFTIPAQSFSISGPTAVATSSSTLFTITGVIPANATNAANDDYDWSATGALSLVGADASGATFLAKSSSGIGVITATSKLTPSVSQTLSVSVTDDPIALFDVASVVSSSSTVSLAGTADSGALGLGIAEVWVIRDVVGATGHDAENPTVSGWTKATLGTTTATAADWSATLPSVPDGAYEVWAKAIGKDGRISAVASKASLTVDTATPTLTETLVGAAPFAVSSGWTFSGTASDATSGLDTLTVAVDGGLPTAVSVASGSWNLNISALPPEGTHTYLFVATDLAGNTKSLLRTIVVDTTGPLLSETTVGVASTAKNAVWTFGGSVSDPNSGLDSLTVTIDNGVPIDLTESAGTWTWVAPLPTNGSHTYTFVATDLADNATTITRSVTFDTTAPNVIISTPTNLAVIAGTTVSLSGSVTDSLSAVASVEYQVDGGGWFTATGTAFWSAEATGLPDGVRVLEVRATDVLGNVSGTTTVSITVKNNVGVTFTIAGYQHLAFSPTTLTIQAGDQPVVATSDPTLLADGTNWKWWVDGVLLGSSASFTLPNTIAVGFHTVSVFVTYTANGSSVDYSQSFDLMVTP